MAQELTASEIRKEIRELSSWFRTANSEGERRWMRLGRLLVKVREEGYWKKWADTDGKVFTLFDDFVEKEVGFSKSKAYALLSVCDNLKLPIAKLEELGKSACYELSRVGKEKPKSLQKILGQIEKESAKGPVSLARIRTMVAVTLEGSHLTNGRYTTLDFLLPEERAGVVIKALKVLQAEEPLENSAGPAARGIHLISLCEEFLSSEEHKKVVKQLEKAGGFSGTNFQLEE